VARLRRAALIIVALLAEEDRQIIGVIVMSRLPAQVDWTAGPRSRARAPGGAAGPAAARRRLAAPRGRAEAIFVLGHPAYYCRFGFSADLAAKIAAPFAGPSFMALELVPGALAGVAGAVTYPAAFARE